MRENPLAYTTFLLLLCRFQLQELCWQGEGFYGAPEEVSGRVWIRRSAAFRNQLMRKYRKCLNGRFRPMHMHDLLQVLNDVPCGSPSESWPRVQMRLSLTVCAPWLQGCQNRPVA